MNKGKPELRTNQQNLCNSVCMQGSITAFLVNWFASWWQGLEDPNILKIIETLLGLDGVRVWRGVRYGERRTERCISLECPLSLCILLEQNTSTLNSSLIIYMYIYVK